MITNFEEMKHPADLKELKAWKIQEIGSIVLTTSIYKPNYSNLEYMLDDDEEILPFRIAYNMQLPETTMTLHSVSGFAGAKKSHKILRLINVFLVEQDDKKRYFIKGIECSKVQFYEMLPRVKSILAPVEERVAMNLELSNSLITKVIKL